MMAGLDSVCKCTSNCLGKLYHRAKQTFQYMASRLFFEWITLGSYLSRAPASARLLFLLHCTHRYNPPVCNPRIIMTNFPRIERLPPYVFNITGELKMAARRRGEDIIEIGRAHV